MREPLRLPEPYRPRRRHFGILRAIMDGGMADVISLRAVRKRMKRAEQQEQAVRNRAASGRPKGERLLEKARADKTQRDLESHRIEPKDGP